MLFFSPKQVPKAKTHKSGRKSKGTKVDNSVQLPGDGDIPPPPGHSIYSGGDGESDQDAEGDYDDGEYDEDASYRDIPPPLDTTNNGAKVEDQDLAPIPLSMAGPEDNSNNEQVGEDEDAEGEDDGGLVPSLAEAPQPPHIKAENLE